MYKYLTTTIFLLCLSLAQFAQADLPSFEFPEAEMTSPGTAQSYYQSLPQTRSPDLPPGRAEAQLNALAAALQYDPEKMFDYVRNSVRRHGVFGVSKGAYGAYLDRNGTDFDQVELLAYLLEQANQNGAGITYEVVVGTVQLTWQELIGWTGITDASVACQTLANGAIPEIFAGNTNCPPSTSPLSSTSVISIAHAWLVVNGEIWDPSYKIVARTGFMDFGSLSQLQSGNLKAAAENGMSYDADSLAVPYIRNINRSEIHAALNQASNTLLQAMTAGNDYSQDSQTSIYGKSADDIYNVARVDVLATRDLAKAPLSNYNPWTTTGLGAFPDAYRIKLTLQVQGSSGYYFGGSVSAFADQFYGRPFSIRARPRSGLPEGENCNHYQSTDAKGLGYLGGFEHSDYCLMITVGETNIAVEENIGTLLSNRSVNLYLDVNHPYAPDNGTYLDADSSEISPLGSTGIISDIVIANAWGGMSERVLSEWSDYFGLDPYVPGPLSVGLEESSGQFYTLYNEGAVSSSGSNYVRHKLAASWMAEKTRFSNVVSGVSGAEIINHRSLGLIFSSVAISNPVAQNWPPVYQDYTLGDQHGWSIANETILLDMRSSDSVSATSDVFPIRRTLATIGAGLESAVFAHVLGTVDTHSVPSKFDYAARSSSDPLIARNEFVESDNWPVDFYYFSDPAECDFAENLIGPEGGLADILVSAVCASLKELFPDVAPSQTTASSPGVVVPGYANLGPSQRYSAIKYSRAVEVPGTIFPSATLYRSCQVPDQSFQTCPMQIDLDSGCLSSQDCLDDMNSTFTNNGNCLSGGLGLSLSFDMSGSLCYDPVAEAWTNWGPWENLTTPSIDAFSSGTTYIPIYDTHPNRGGAIISWNEAGRTSPLVAGYSGIAKGGGADMTPTEVQAQSLPSLDNLLGQGGDLSPFFSVDEFSGNVTIGTGPLVSVGAGPSSLSFERTTTSGARGIKEPVWTHSFDIQAGISSSGLEALGAMRPEASTASIVSVMAMLDLYASDFSSPKDILVREVAAPLIMYWWQMQTLHNTVSVRTGATTARYVRLADGTYVGPPGSTSSVSMSGAPYETERKYDWYRTDAYNEAAQSFEWKYDQVSFTVTDGEGNQTEFDYHEIEEVEPWEGQVRSDRTNNWGWKYFWLPDRTLLKTGGVIDYNLTATSRGVVSGWVENAQGNRIDFGEQSVSDENQNTARFGNTFAQFPDGGRLDYEFSVNQKFGSFALPLGVSPSVQTNDHRGFEFVGVSKITQTGTHGTSRVLADIGFDADDNVLYIRHFPNGQTGAGAGIEIRYYIGNGVFSSVADETDAKTTTLYRGVDGAAVFSEDPVGRKTLNVLNGLGYSLEERLLGTADEEGSDWSGISRRVFDRYGNILFEVALSRTDGSGTPLTSDVLVSQYRYDDVRWPRKRTKQIDPEGYAVTFEYDDKGQLVREIGPFKDVASGTVQDLPDYFGVAALSFSNADDPGCHDREVKCTEYIYDYTSEIVAPAQSTTQFGYLVEMRTKLEDPSDGLGADEVWQREIHEYWDSSHQYLPRQIRTLPRGTYPGGAQ